MSLTEGARSTALTHAASSNSKSGRPESSTIHPHLNRFSHWDVNVENLERAREWYEATTNMRVVAETNADQPFPSLDIPRGRFKGYMLRDIGNAPPYPMIHLVEWQTPKTEGTVYPTASNVGWCRIAHNVANTAEARARVVGKGSEPFFPTGTHTNPPFHPLGPPIYYDAFCVRDPDGIIHQFFGADSADKTSALGASTRSPMVVNFNTADIDRNAPFFGGLLGLDASVVLQTSGPWQNIYDERGGEVQFEGLFWTPRGDDRVAFDWLTFPETRTTYSTPYHKHNNRGIIRSAIEVDDIGACYNILKDSGWNKDMRIVLGPPEEWNLGSQIGTRAVLNFKSPEGVYFQLVQQPTPPIGKNYPNAEEILHPYGDVTRLDV